MKMLVEFIEVDELEDIAIRGYKVVIEGRDYAHIHKKARRRCQYRKHNYNETWTLGSMKVVK